MVPGIFGPYAGYSISTHQAAEKQSRSQIMKMKYLLAALPLALSLAMSAAAEAHTRPISAPPQAYGIVGREVAAPSWSAACMTDHGPSDCGEPAWIYGSPGAIAKYRSAF
jgi:hypothetical protein